MPPSNPTVDAVLDTYRRLFALDAGPGRAALAAADGATSARQMAAMLLQTQFMCAYDVRAEQLVFVSPGVETLLGQPVTGFSLEWLYARVHPDEAVLIAQATALSAAWLGEVRHASWGHVFSADYRLRHAAEHYVRVLRQNMVLQLDADGRPVVVGSIYTDLTSHKRTTDVHLHCTHPQAAAMLRRLQYPAGTSALSRREQQVLDLVLRGFSSAEIAVQLYVSFHTVSTHRRNIAAKTLTGQRLHLLSSPKLPPSAK